MSFLSLPSMLKSEVEPPSAFIISFVAVGGTHCLLLFFLGSLISSPLLTANGCSQIN